MHTCTAELHGRDIPSLTGCVHIKFHKLLNSSLGVLCVRITMKLKDSEGTLHHLTSGIVCKLPNS